MAEIGQWLPGCFNSYRCVYSRRTKSHIIGYDRAMTSRHWLRNTAFACTLFVSGLLGPVHARQTATRKSNVSITVSAAASLKDALQEVAKAFQSLHPDIVPALNFGASGTLEVQIERGAPVDVFISAASDQMDVLAAKGLLRKDSRVDVLRNEIVLIVPSDSRTISGFADLRRPEVRFVALGDPRAVPAGSYARQTLTALGLYDAVRGKQVLATDVRQVLADVETSSADAGLVYATDAAVSKRVRVVAEAPMGTHKPIVYPAAVMRDAPQPEAARVFMDFLHGPQARAVFARYGFRSAAN